MTLNKEKVLFLCVCLVSILFFNRTIFSTPEKKEIFEKLENKTAVWISFPVLKQAVFPEALHIYYPGLLRDPFHKISEKKKLNPPPWILPEPELANTMPLPPVPAPASQYWSEFPVNPFPVLQSESIPLQSSDVEGCFPAKETKPLGEIAQSLKQGVQENDIILTNSGASLQGRIINEDAQEVILHVSDKKAVQNMVLPKSSIAQMKKRIGLPEICMQRFKSLNEKDANTLLNLAKACAELDVDDVTAKLFQTLLNRFPSFTEGYLAYSDYNLDRLEVDKAYAILLLAVEKKAENEDVRLYISRIQNFLGLKRKAVETLGIKPDFSGINLLQQKESLELAMNLAFSMRNINLAEKILERAKTVAGNDPSWQNMLCYWQARLSFHYGQIAETITACTKTVDPVPSRIHSLRGAALYLHGSLPDAAVHLKLAAEGGDVWALYNLALVYFAGGLQDMAIEILQKIQSKPGILQDPSTIKATLGYMTYFRDPEKNYDEAEKLIKSALESNPDNMLCYFLSGFLQESRSMDKPTKTNETEDNKQNSPRMEAYRSYRQAIAMDFNFTHALIRLGILSLCNDNIPESMKYLTEAMKRPLPKGKKADIYSWIARSYIAQNDVEKGKIALAQALKMDPGHIFSLKLQAWIYNKEENWKETFSCLDSILAKKPDDEYAIKAKQTSLYYKNLVVWQDSFSRPNGEQVRRRWEESEQDGIEISLRHHQVVFGGQNIEGKIPSTMLREIPKETFVSFSARLGVAEAKEAYAGIIITSPKLGDGPAIYFGKDIQNCLVYSASDSGKIQKWEKILEENRPLTWPAQDSVKLTIAMSPSKKNHYQLLLDDKMVAEVFVPPIRTDKMKGGIYGFAIGNNFWKFQTDEVQIIEKE